MIICDENSNLGLLKVINQVEFSVNENCVKAPTFKLKEQNFYAMMLSRKIAWNVLGYAIILIKRHALFYAIL